MASKEADRDSAEWLRGLNAEGPTREEAVTRLRALLLRVARAVATQRRASLPDRGWEEVDDLCHQAASDAAMAILRKLPEFRGDSRFTTWACKFAMFEISTRLRRHAWRHRKIEVDEQVWDRLADSAPPALTRLEQNETLHSLQRAIRNDLTDRQRLIFQAAVLDEVPIDVLAERLDSTRGAIYKILHDARARLRKAIAHSEGKEERV
ncbi:MAG TPA: sigma-70 family RNA polymerase sigma factor [Gemmatimonadales bacterium]|nr:sigma-70 family RNA polymerase sigma factor [Gemmatimonadales bacterium]